MSALTERLDAIQARVDAATPGPWEWSKESEGWGDCGPNLETAKRGPVYSDGSQGADEVVIGSWGHDANGISVEYADAEFIAAAPSDVTFLLDLARKQQAVIEASKPRTITTAEELDALGRGSTVLDSLGDVWTHDGDPEDQWGSVTAKEDFGGPQWYGSANIPLPSTILYGPEAQA